MAPIWPLEHLFESPAKIEQRQREERAAARVSTGDREGDPPTFRCRICRYQGPQPRFCPTCLADTMVILEGQKR